MAGATWNCCFLGAYSVYTMQLYTSLQCHFIQCHIRTNVECVEWLGSLCANGITRGWNGHQNMTLCRKLTLENIILPLLLQGLNLAITSLILGSHNRRSLQLFPKMYYSASPALTLSLRSETMLLLENTAHMLETTTPCNRWKLFLSLHFCLVWQHHEVLQTSVTASKTFRIGAQKLHSSATYWSHLC